MLPRFIKASLIQGFTPPLWKSIIEKMALLRPMIFFLTPEKATPDMNINPVGCLVNVSHGLRPPRD
jgi:hypothetical protein